MAITYQARILLLGLNRTSVGLKLDVVNLDKDGQFKASIEPAWD